jgi:RNAse (barnase) inhibitor barstar
VATITSTRFVRPASTRAARGVSYAEARGTRPTPVSTLPIITNHSAASASEDNVPAAPDLTQFDECGVRAWKGAADALKTQAAQANLRHVVVDLGHARDRATLFSTLDGALKLPEHFGHNFDALADVLEDRDWLGKRGIVITLLHSTDYRRDHPHEWSTLEDLFTEACDYWRDRHVPFWVFLA